MQGPGELTLTAIVLFGLGLYAVTTGAVAGEQRVVAIGVFAFTLFAIGVVTPIVALAGVDLDVVAPPEATVGDELPLQVRVHGRLGRLELRVLDPEGPWLRTPAPSAGTVPHVAARRGVFDAVRLQVRTAAPLGVFARTRQALVRLPVPIEVGPEPAAAAVELRPLPDSALGGSTGGGAGGDTVRAVRPYVAGDSARLVHWATSARRGELVVRELDPPAKLGLALVVDLTGPPESAERAASLAAGIGRSVLACGGALWLSTCEPAGALGALVSDARALNRRLARAVPGAPASPPGEWPVQELRATAIEPGTWS